VIDLLFETSRTGGVAMVLAAVGSVALGSIGAMLSATPMGGAMGGAMLPLARVMAVVCGLAGLLGAAAGVLYYRMVGQVGFDQAVLAEAGLAGLAAVWLVAVAVLLHRDGERA